VDGVLIASIEGELLDFGDLYEREFGRVYRAAWLLARHDDIALDATQEAFAKAWARWRRLRHQEWVVGWVIRTSLNEVRDRSKTKSADREPKDQVVNDPSWASLMDLRQALQSLPPTFRSAA
jgi:RNA polymerase sigma-70 factor (ECF subfamily)